MRARFVLAAAVLGWTVLPVPGHALTLQVNCDQPKSKLPTIGAALQLLSGLVGNLGPNTIEVTGSCKENVSVDGLSDLTLAAKNGASITDASGGTAPTLTVSKSSNFGLKGFAIRGGGGQINGGVLCIWNSTCYLSSNDVQNTGGNAVTAALGATVALDHDVLEQSVIGLWVFSGARAEVVAATMRNNVIGANVTFGSYYADRDATIANNSFWGLSVNNHSSAATGGDSITGNGVGVFVNVQSEVGFAPTGNTVNGNVTGVSIGDQSWVNFLGAATVSGSGTQPDIQCWGRFSGASGVAGVGATNCPP
ncbi:MAG TPA: hypothetical protein VL131_01540 [Gammaproteobacteria bacterium]|nr:hypothetical protein [Gammaproteobacteria bacterium]